MGAICFFDGFLVGVREPRITNKGMTVQNFGLSVVTNPNAQNSDDRYSIFNFIAFGEAAEQLAGDYHAGRRYAHIQGAPRVEKYVDNSGMERRSVAFWANKIACYTRNEPPVESDRRLPGAYQNGQNSQNGNARRNQPMSNNNVSRASDPAPEFEG